MRRLKFRVWNHYTNSWYQNSMDYLKFHLGEDYPPTINVDKMGLGVVPTRYIQQFTGMRDQYSVEIYEGDIITWTVGKFMGRNYVVRFEEESDALDVSGYMFTSYASKVIGNIFENPELIAS
jgi:hypothetical protein